MSDATTNDIRERIARAINSRRSDEARLLSGPRMTDEAEAYHRGVEDGLAEGARIARETPPWIDVDASPPAAGQTVLIRSTMTGHPFVAMWDAGNGVFRDDEGGIIPGMYWMEIPEGKPDNLSPVAREMVAGMEEFREHLKAGGTAGDWQTKD